MSGEPSFNRTKSLVEGALFAALVIISYVADLGTGLLVWLAPIPIAIICFRHGAGNALMTSVAAALGVGMILGLFSGISVLTGITAIGIAVGLCLKKNYSDVKSVALVILGVLLSLAAVLLTGVVVSGISVTGLGSDLLAMVDTSIEGAMEIYQASGLSTDQINTLGQMLAQLKDTLIRLFPAIFVIACSVVSALYVFLTKFIVRKMGFKFSEVEPFIKWRLPWTFIWGLISGLALLVVGNIIEQNTLTYIGINLTFIFGFIYMVQGVSVIYSLMDKYKVSKIFKVFLVIMLFMLGEFQVMVAIFGLSDIWLDWRSRLSGEDNKTE